MPTSNRKLPKTAAPAYAAPAPSTRPMPTKRAIGPTNPVAAPGVDMAARHQLMAEFGQRNLREVSLPALHTAIADLQRAGVSLARLSPHPGRTLLAALTHEVSRRAAQTAGQPRGPMPMRAGGYAEAVRNVAGPEGFARMVTER